MTKIQNPILSICIPTYNRSKYLVSCLQSILKQVKDYMHIEILVSDNQSTDDTNQQIQQFINHPKFKYFLQTENLGATKNYFKLVSDYATGDFCWIIGDDDFLVQGALDVVYNLITQYKDTTDYFYASVKGLNVEDYNKHTNFDTTLLSDRVTKENIVFSEVDKFEELISPRYSIIFLGELMASIFRRELWISHEINIEGENLASLQTTYPHAVVLASKFMGSKAIYIKTPLIRDLSGAREWWDKLGYILVVQVKNLLDYYKDLGVSKKILKECYKSYLQMSFKYFLKFLFQRKSQYRNKVSISNYSIFLLNNPTVSVSFFSKLIAGRLKFLLQKK
ncbi:glycosyltransferase family 2 protein [Mucilaginibacter sp. KACC 22063]|uniref:glycosyltransferase family 2 protein n=1 Tax=Mucilaginibacter sp. KACC 22063 TaxID=3025666 RepID=UPI002365573F|nr:glycosyltransferase family 2 protein [Mucilaginibacter sp. KACC 22063]WDF54707.1 glycosyltransferase family 2 protein [Mucilaginibacter sp. KACC 22063]